MRHHEFTNKFAIVTGGGSGIGEATVKSLLAGGARVLVTDIDEKNGQRVSRDSGDNAEFFRADATNPEHAEAAVARCVELFGGLDIAVNNAGIGGPAARTGAYPIDAWRQVMSVNLDGVFYGMRYQIPAMVERGGGSIVNVSSVLGSVGFAAASAYTAAKHGVIGLTKTAALEYGAQHIRVNAVGAGFIPSALLPGALDEETLATLAGQHALGRLGRAEEVAALIAFLASDDASFVTGSYHLADGGYTAQ